MKRTILSLFAGFLLSGSVGSLADAQNTLTLTQPGGGLTSANAAAHAPPTSTETARTSEMPGMLAAHNEARARLGLPAMTWSADLAGKAAATTKIAATGSCSFNKAQKAGETENAGIFWASGLRRLGAGSSAQEISANYVVSRWSEGGGDYDIATGKCLTRSGNCEPFSRMVAPKAKTVGCARPICPTQTQIWACHYKE